MVGSESKAGFKMLASSIPREKQVLVSSLFMFCYQTMSLFQSKKGCDHSRQAVTSAKFCYIIQNGEGVTRERKVILTWRDL